MEPSAGRGAKQREQVRREHSSIACWTEPLSRDGEEHHPGVLIAYEQWSHGGWTRHMSQIPAREGEVPVTLGNIHLCSNLCCKALIPFHPDLHRRPAQGHDEDDERVQFLPHPTTLWNFSPGPGRPQNSRGVAAPSNHPSVVAPQRAVTGC